MKLRNWYLKGAVLAAVISSTTCMVAQTVLAEAKLFHLEQSRAPNKIPHRSFKSAYGISLDYAALERGRFSVRVPSHGTMNARVDSISHRMINGMSTMIIRGDLITRVIGRKRGSFVISRAIDSNNKVGLAGTLDLDHSTSLALRFSEKNGDIELQEQDRQLIPSADFKVLDPKKVKHPREAAGELRTVSVDLVKQAAARNISANATSTIDVLAGYTIEAANDAGGEAGVTALITSWASTVNSEYVNSGTNTQINLVGIVPTNEHEVVDFNANLNRLTSQGDGYYDAMHTARDSYRADLVTLFIKTTGADDGSGYLTCGLAWLGAKSEEMSGSLSQYMALGFSAVTTNRYCGAETWSHELGHNFGCNHDPANAGSNDGSYYDYSYGYRFNGTDGVQYRTIMAYEPGEPAGYFSNPGITFKGRAVGNASAYNTQVIANTAPIIAEYYSGSGTGIPLPPSTGGGDDGDGNGGIGDGSSVDYVDLTGGVRRNGARVVAKLRAWAYLGEDTVSGASVVINYAPNKRTTEVTIAGPKLTVDGDVQFTIKKPKKGLYRACVGTVCSRYLKYSRAR